MFEFSGNGDYNKVSGLTAAYIYNEKYSNLRIHF